MNFKDWLHRMEKPPGMKGTATFYSQVEPKGNQKSNPLDPPPAVIQVTNSLQGHGDSPQMHDFGLWEEGRNTQRDRLRKRGEPRGGSSLFFIHALTIGQFSGAGRDGTM